jgi:predicted acetyltransferase
MQIDLLQATEDDLPIVRNLVSYYVYEISGPMGWECNAEGVFGGCDDLAEYWRTNHPETPPEDQWPEPKWRGYPFVIRVDHLTAGFVLVKQYGERAEPSYDMSEFFVLRQYQRQGVGQAAACEAFDQFRGLWEVRQLLQNTPAVAFWRKVIGAYTGGRFSEVKKEEPHYGIEMNFMRFDNRL